MRIRNDSIYTLSRLYSKTKKHKVRIVLSNQGANKNKWTQSSKKPNDRTLVGTKHKHMLLVAMRTATQREWSLC